jgi:tetratricopeptide (TPR) repeat protein
MGGKPVIGFAGVKVSRRTLFGVAAVIFAATVWLYWPSTHGGFLRVDDVEYLRQSVRSNGLTWNAVKWAFTSTDMYYHPLPRLFYVLGYQIWGTDAAGHHATSVFLHALNVALVFGFLWTLLGATSLATGERFMVALWVAVVFAIHPLQTESVAWMSVRTQLLCTAFGIGSIWAYAAGARRWLVWTLYVAALLCKPMAVSLPFVMLAIDYFPLSRHERLGWGRLVWEKAVMIVGAGVVGVATVITDRGRGPMAPLFVAPLSVRVFRVFESLTFYPWKLVWPAHLSPNYVSDVPLGLWPVVASVLTVLIITAVVTCQRRRLPMLAAAWGAYVMLVLPVSALMPRGRQVVAPRYAYVAMLPILLLAGAAGVWVWRRSTTAVRVGLVGLLAWGLCAFAAGTRRLIPDWQNDETMRRAAWVEFPDSEEANRDLATELLDRGKASEALEYARRGVEIAPQQCEAHVVLGRVLCRLGRLPEAMAEHEQAFRLNDNPLLAHYNFGLALIELHKPAEAAKEFEQALKIKPDNPVAHYNLGKALAQLGRVPDAMQEYNSALRLDPDFVEAHYSLGLLLEQAGQTPEAIAQYELALQISPEYADAHNNLGVTLARLGRVQEAVGHWEQALRTRPDSAQAHNNLGHALAQMGRIPEAIAHLEQALQIDPDYAGAHVNLGIALMRLGRVPEAMGHWEQALRLNPDIVEAHFNLAVALEKTGRTREAIDHYQQVLRLRPDHMSAKDALVRLGAVQ